jgi:hypothetical protein
VPSALSGSLRDLGSDSVTRVFGGCVILRHFQAWTPFGHDLHAYGEEQRSHEDGCRFTRPEHPCQAHGHWLLDMWSFAEEVGELAVLDGTECFPNPPQGFHQDGTLHSECDLLGLEE